MAARKNLDHIEKTRQKIANSMLVNKLIDHVNGKVEMKASQVRAADILLKKTIPDLSSVMLSGDPEKPIHVHDQKYQEVLDRYYQKTHKQQETKQ